MNDTIKKILEESDNLKGMLEGAGVTHATDEITKMLKDIGRNPLLDQMAKFDGGLADRLLGHEKSLNNSVFSHIPDMRMPTHEEVHEYQSASALMQALAEEALSWKEQLPENMEPAILAFLYGGVQIQVHSLSKVTFHGIRIEGTLNGSPCAMFAHQSTVQILCYAKEATKEEPRRSIGFIWDDKQVKV